MLGWVIIMRKLLLLIILLVTPILAQAQGAGTAASVYRTTFANLGTPADGSVRYVTDGTANTSPCTGGGTGAFATRVNGAWSCASAAASEGGSGTLNTIAKFTPDGTHIGNSQITDDGTNINATLGGNFTVVADTAVTISAAGDASDSVSITGGGNVKLTLGGNTDRTFLLGRTSAQVQGDASAQTLISTAGVSQSFITPNIKVTVTSDLTATPTVSTPGGIVRIAAAASTLTVTCTICTASTLIFVTVRTNDATLKSVVAVPGSGSFVLTGNAAATANTDIQVWVVNPN